MSNPFEIIDARLANIENLLLDIKHGPKKPDDLPDRINLNELCKEFGFTKPFIYKETSIQGKKGMPCKRFGNRLVFSRKEILQWMTERTVRKQSPDEIATRNLQVSARKKSRNLAF